MADYLRSQVAKISGLSSETLRYYEKKGLILPGRIGNGYRIYPEVIFNRLNFIKRAKEAGFTLEEIRKTLQLCDCQMDFRDISSIMAEGIADKIKEIDARISNLIEIRQILGEIHHSLLEQHVCPSLQSLLKKTE